MTKTSLMLIAVAMLTAPLVLAHQPMGTPKNYCEYPGWEWREHDYGPAGTIDVLGPPIDGNLGGDCDPGFSLGPYTPCGAIYLDRPLDSDPGICPAPLNLPFADRDGHSEYASDGAWLLSANGASSYCFGESGHHPAYPQVEVYDFLLGAGVVFVVGADTTDDTIPRDAVYYAANSLPTGGSCGDGIDDVWIVCVGVCWVPFPPGLDGSYHVYVEGTVGHVRTD